MAPPVNLWQCPLQGPGKFRTLTPKVMLVKSTGADSTQSTLPTAETSVVNHSFSGKPYGELVRSTGLVTVGKFFLLQL